MPKNLVVKMECDRCGAVWYADYQEGTPLPQAPSLALSFANPVDTTPLSASFSVLCKRCTDAVGNYVKNILKVRDPKDEEGEPAKESEAKEQPKPPPRLERQGRDRGVY